jgi:hypothetical protein
MAQEIGALIISLRANSAAFQAEMDTARKGLEGVGAGGIKAGAGLSHFATIAVRELVPGLYVSTREMSTLIRLATTATGVLGTLAQGALIAGAALVGYSAGNAISNFRQLLREGTGWNEALKQSIGLTKSYEAAQKEANEEQKKFLEVLVATRAAHLANAKTLAEISGKGAVGARKLSGDESGAVAAQLEATLRGIELEKQARDAALADAIRSGKIAANARASLERENVAIIRGLRVNAYLDEALAQKKLREEAAAAQFKTWQTETEFLTSELQKRVRLRQDFDQQLGQGGLEGKGTAGGLGAVGSLQRQLEKETRDLAGARRSGLLSDKEYFEELENIQARAFAVAQDLYDTWGDFPAVMRAITQAVGRMNAGFGILGDVMAGAAAWAERFVPTTQELTDAQAALTQQFTQIPEAAAGAGEAVRKLANEYNDLAWQVYGATQQIYRATTAMRTFESVSDE